jgi:MIP family channel proteins
LGHAVTLGVYVAGGVSGAHLNAAVTLALAVRRGFPWPKVAAYWLAQYAGAFASSAVVYASYREALDDFDGSVRQVSGPQATADIWATYPQAFLSPLPGGMLDQVIGTAFLTLLIFALSDRRNLAPPVWFGPSAVGADVLAVGMTFGYNSGYAINPARDLSPRLFTAVAGWGRGVSRRPRLVVGADRRRSRWRRRLRRLHRPAPSA